MKEISIAIQIMEGMKVTILMVALTITMKKKRKTKSKIAKMPVWMVLNLKSS